MTQETLNKLMELKQLFEQGILTKEELELEKAKILGTTEHQELENEEQIPIPEDIESEVAEENEEITQPTAYTYPYAMPSMMPAQIQPESPANEHSLTSEYNLIDDEEDNNDHTMRWIVAICVAGLLALLLICYSQCGGSTDTNPNEYDVCDTAACVESMDEQDEPYEEICIEGICLNDGYDETLEKLKNDPSNKERGMVADECGIILFCKSYYGVDFDYVDFTFSDDVVKSIRLRKTLNIYDSNSQETIDNEYFRISKKLGAKFSVVEKETSDEVVYRNGSSTIKVSKSEISEGNYELTVTIEHD